MPDNLFRIKICGLRTEQDVSAVVAAGADAVGFNFYPSSRRYVSPDQAANLIRRLPTEIRRVGVFVNETAERVRDLAERLPLDYVQIHGDEPEEYITHFDPQQVIKAFRFHATQLDVISDYLRNCRDAGSLPAAVLIDAHAKDGYGGTGKTADWQLLATEKPRFLGLPIVLAGGLEARNVGAAVACVRPTAVDTASGVESSPGIKAPDLIQRFVDAAKEALANDGVV